DDPHEIDNNNFKARPITVLGSPPPDLVVKTVTASDHVAGGTSVNVTWTVKNEGLVATEEESWNDDIYLSDSPILGAGHQFGLGSVVHSGKLDSRASYTV